MKRYVAVAVVLVAAILVVAAADHHRMARELAALKAARDSEAPVDVPGGVPALGDRAPTARAHWRRGALAPGAAGPGAAGPEPSAAAGKPASPSRSPAEQIAHIDEVFTSEDTDAEWASTTSTTLELELRKRAPKGFGFQSISCRTTLCKIEVTVPDEPAYQSLMDAALAPPTLWEGALVALRNQNEGAGRHVGGVMFFARPGRDMPYLTN